MDLTNPNPGHIDQAPHQKTATPGPIREALFGRALAAAIASVVLGLLSVFQLLMAIPGLPALVLGFLGLRWLNVLDDSESPSPRVTWARRLAIAGLALGLVGVVMGVVSVVMLILLQVGEVSRRATCANNLRQIGMAVAGYHEHNDLFPTATVAVPPDAPLHDAGFEDRLSWYVSLLPYLGRHPEEKGEKGRAAAARSRLDALHARLDLREAWFAPANAEARATILQPLLCPSHPLYDPEELPAPTHYVGITGIGPGAAELPTGSPRAGFFGYERRLRLRALKPGEGLPAGLSNTMMCAESMVANGPWAAGGPPTARSLLPDQKPYLGYGRPFGGMHPGGANLLMAGGEVRFFTEEGSPHVLETLATVGRGEW